MEELLARFWEHLGGRVGGPLTFRLLVQPAVAAWLAIRAGLRDAREGRPIYLFAMLTDPTHRRQLREEGWKSMGMRFLLAMALDALYQLIVFRWIYPLELLLVAALLSLIPYALIRGPVNRIARLRRRR